jgi:hypothetical protein
MNSSKNSHREAFKCFYYQLPQQDINKRLSLPADLHLPESFVAKQNASPTIDGPLSRASRRQSLSEIGFGRMETYTKLDKLGQVCECSFTVYINMREPFPVFCWGGLNSTVYSTKPSIKFNLTHYFTIIFCSYVKTPGIFHHHMNYFMFAVDECVFINGNHCTIVMEITLK